MIVAALPTALRASVVLRALRASVSSEPRMLAVYLLLLVVPWVIWEGVRTRGEEPPAPSGKEKPRSRGGSPGARKPSGRTERRARKRRPGHIDWIQ